MGADPFFQDGLGLNIEARDAAGDVSDPGARSSVAWMKAAAQRAFVGVAMAASTMAAGSALAAEPAPAAVSAPVAQSIPFTQEEFDLRGKGALEALMKVSPSVRMNMSHFEITDEKRDEAQTGPYVSVDNEIKGYGCMISMMGLDEIHDDAAKKMGSSHRFNAAEKAVLAELTLVHEVAHCEFHTAKMLPIDGPIGPAVNATVDFAEKLWENVREKSGHLMGVSRLTSERQADAYAMLDYAAKVFEGADTPAEIKAGLKKFDFAMDTQMKWRKNEVDMVHRDGGHHHTHDTGIVLKAVKNLVHQAAQSPKAMETFKANVLEGDNLSISATKLSIGSVRADLPRIHENQISDAVTFLRRENIEHDIPQQTKHLYSLRGQIDRLKVNDVEFDEGSRSFLKESDRMFAASQINPEQSQRTSTLVNSLMKRIVESEANVPASKHQHQHPRPAGM